MKRGRLVSVLAVAGFWAAVGCSSDDSGLNEDRVCEPGDQKSCACPGSDDGAQVCADDGSRWGECVCSQDGTGGSAGAAGSAGSATPRTGCPDGTVPCGDGCRPANDTVCCDDGRRTTSSFCTIAAGGVCYPNDRNCQAVYPSGAVAEFCCSSSGSTGSHDCPPGEHHCGTPCVPESERCCTGEECTSFRVSSDCEEVDNPCGYCPYLDGGMCLYCPPGSCCGGDTCARPGAGLVCVQSEVCVGLPTWE